MICCQPSTVAALPSLALLIASIYDIFISFLCQLLIGDSILIFLHTFHHTPMQ